MTEQSIRERMTEIAQVALDSTRRGQTTWRPTDDPDAFLATFSKTSLIIDHYPGNGGFKLSLLTAHGTNVEELVSDAPARPDPWRTPDADPWSTPQVTDDTHTVLRQLHDAARRSALNIDDLLDSAIADLRRGTGDDDLPF